MYIKHTSKLGDYTVISLQNKQTNNAFSFVPELGACLTNLTFQNTSILNGYTTTEELATLYYSKSSLLLPFPNRLKDGQYTWKNKDYQFPINDTNTNTALHGFIQHKSLIISDLQLTGTFAKVTLTYDYQGELDYYPFPFLFKVSYKIDNDNRFSVSFFVENKGNMNMPIGLGWHPYFKLSETVNDMELQLPPCEKIDVDERLLPTGKQGFFTDFAQQKPIGSTIFDNGFYFSEKDKKVKIILKGTKGILYYQQSSGERKFNYLQLFTPSDRKSIAIEPMTCTINAFNNGEGLIDLKAGEMTTTNCDMRFELSKK